MIIKKKKIDIICSSIGKAFTIPKEMNKQFQRVVEVQINESIEQILKKFRIDFPEMKFTLEIDSEIPIIRCRSFEGVISNLVRNAAEATKGHGCVSIFVKSIKFKDLNEEYVEIIVDDNGSGVPTEDKDKIFEWDYTTKQEKEAKGFGFGLAWTRTLVEVEGGKIKAETNDQGGARFIVKYPVTFTKNKEN